MSETRSVDPAVEEPLDAFIETLQDSETYRAFEAATEQLEADEAAMELLAAYREKQRAVQTGEFDSSDMSELRELKTELSETETFREQQAAQAALVALLKRTDDRISDRIGRPFARSDGGGCC
ncbi:YlbF family regulator [Natronomonas sp. LN261]|jgi:cell fate (sporulation/competence/biofilm development) regulator YlbF (YheA/YmcA/DUF963 family)|uniref:YlbF family regulator n=1 Tax=Natronomonas sp. LN261 TaxID=2750669 RepID=UPI0015EF6CF7|nr:YlbF family regulator [Natronomonas sp. LN261]